MRNAILCVLFVLLIFFHQRFRRNFNFFKVNQMGKGKIKYNKWAAVPIQLCSVPAHALLIVRALLPLIGVELAVGPWGSSSVFVFVRKDTAGLFGQILGCTN